MRGRTVLYVPPGRTINNDNKFQTKVINWWVRYNLYIMFNDMCRSFISSEFKFFTALHFYKLTLSCVKWGRGYIITGKHENRAIRQPHPSSPTPNRNVNS